MGYYRACTSTMNLSLNSLKSDICLDSRNFDFSSLPSFDKINTFWQSTPGGRAPNGQTAASKLDAMQKLLSAKPASPDQPLTKEVPSAEPANEASPKAAPAKKDDAEDEEYNPNFNMSKSKKEKRPLPKEFKPSAFSVICGRTQNCYNSTGYVPLLFLLYLSNLYQHGLLTLTPLATALLSSEIAVSVSRSNSFCKITWKPRANPKSRLSSLVSWK